MLLKKIRNLVKKIPLAKFLFYKIKLFIEFIKSFIFNKVKISNTRFIKIIKINFLNQINFKIAFFKVKSDPKIVEKIISSSIYKNSNQLINLIDKGIYYQHRILLNHDDNLDKCDEFFLLGRLYFYKGDSRNSIKYLQKEDSLRTELKNNSIYKNLDEIFIPRNTIHVLGLIGHLDGLIKFHKLNNLITKISLIGDRNTIINKYFFSLYEGFVNFIKIDEATSEILLKERYLSKNIHWVLENDRGILQLCHKTFANSVSRWKEKSYKPLIEISSSNDKDLYDFKKFFNFPVNAKFICIHIRTSDFYDSHNKSADSYRDSDFNTYIKTINYINSLGFYVVRIGDKIKNREIFNKLENREMFIDYPNSKYKSGKMDLILANSCIFYIATDSGPHWYAGSLLKNLCIVNSPIKDGFPYYRGSIFLPIKYKIKGIEIHFRDILKSYTNCHFQWQFDNCEIEIEKNNDYEIKKTIQESFFENKLIMDYPFKNKKKLISLREEFIDLNKRYGTNVLSKPSEIYINRLNSIYN